MDVGEQEQMDALIQYELSAALKRLDVNIGSIRKANADGSSANSIGLVQAIISVLAHEYALLSRHIAKLLDKSDFTDEASSYIYLEAISGFHALEKLALETLLQLEEFANAKLAAIEKLRQSRSDAEAKLLLLRIGFENGVEGELTETLIGVPQNRGGRPKAEHWDKMWAHIAVRLLNVEFEPKNQAAIKDEMFDWLTAKGIEASDTAVTQRARALWQEVRMYDDK